MTWCHDHDSSHMNSDVQEFIIYVIYGHADIVSSCNFCFGSDPFGSWNRLDMIKKFIESLSNFFGKNNLEFEPEEKKVHKLLIDVCIEEARTPKPANYRFSNL